MSAKPVDPDDPFGEDGRSREDSEPGKRRIRVSDDRGLSLAGRIANQLYRMTWGTPLHAMRLKGKFPLKLLAVPNDELPGDARAGKAIRAGHFLFRGLKQPIEGIDFGHIDQPRDFQDYIHSFRWLRDLAAAGAHEQLAPVTERIVRGWLAVHAETPSEPAWRADIAGWRVLFWAAYAPYVIGGDPVCRSAILNGIARTGRHLERGADKVPVGLTRIAAWGGTVAAALLLPGGETRRPAGEAGLHAALTSGIHGDGGIVSRSPLEQVGAIELLGLLRAAYVARGQDAPVFLTEALERLVAALLGIMMGDGSIGSWQGAAPLEPDHLRNLIHMSRVRTRAPLEAREWGYQRLSAGQTIVVIDAAPPPVARLAGGGCASTAAIELADGQTRIVVSCGGAAMGGAAIPPSLARGLRTSAAHSTLILADTNSTAIMPDGALGKGVQEVELDIVELEEGSRLDMSHDGYARRLGFLHRRLLLLSPDGRQLRGEDIVTPADARRKVAPCDYAIRFHLGLDVEPTLTADGRGAVLRLLPDSALWQFRVGDAKLEIEESCWIDGEGRPHPSRQLVVSGQTTPEGASVGWLFKRSG
ncbi:MAG: heparinase II/III family protein [Sphingobium sp.]